MSYSFTMGTGTLPGASSQVARCGVSVPTEPPRVEAPTDAGSATGDTTPLISVQPQKSGLAAETEGETQARQLLEEGNDPVCCNFDETTASYRCGDPSGFPNKVQSFEASNGDRMVLYCLDIDRETAQDAAEIGIEYIGGEPLRAEPICCAVSLTYLEVALAGDVSDLDVNRLINQCAPSSVALASGIGSSAGGFTAASEVYAEGQLQMYAEKRTSAYEIDVDGRVSFISQVNPGEEPDSYNLRGRMSRLAAAYRHYFDESASPFFGLGIADLDATAFDVVKYTDTETGTLYEIPARVTIGAGLGRIYEIEPRLRLKKLEALLLDHGVIGAPLPHEVARDIMIAWWTLRSEIGYDRRLLYTLKILDDRKLLTGPVTAATVYRFGEIINDPQLLSRRQGEQTSLQLRAGKRLEKDVDTEVTVVVEAHDTRVFNLDYDSELFWDIAVGVAPRKEDWLDNRLAGSQMPFPGVVGGLVAVNVPVGYRWYRYDGYLNKLGAIEAQLRLSAGYGNDAGIVSAPDGLATVVGGTLAYTMFESVSHGVTFSASSDVGWLDDRFVYSVLGGISMTFGIRESYYVAPGDLGPALPFDLPLPTTVVP